MEEYLVPTQYGEDEFIERKSRFIGRVWPVETEEEALAKIHLMHSLLSFQETMFTLNDMTKINIKIRFTKIKTIIFHFLKIMGQ